MIEVENLCKSFYVSRRDAGLSKAISAFFRREKEEIKALDHISFQIGDGEMVGYIGPNGAGKSSTIKVLSGILTPDSGLCRINGRVPWKERKAHVNEIGVVFGQRSQLWWDVPVIDSFELLKEIYRVPEAEYRRTLEELVDLLNLSEIVRTPARQLSLGQRMRCEIAASLIHQPKILFLDEPTIGLDAVSKLAVRRFILELNQRRGTTVILTTHDMQDIEALTKRIILIGKGKILFDGSLEEIRRKSADRRLLKLSYEGTLPPLPEGLTLTKSDIGQAVFSLDPAKIPVSDAIAFLAGKTGVRDLSVESPTVEETIAALYARYQI